MSFWRKTRASSVLAACLCLLTGCWDRTETNDLAFVLSSSIDKEGDGLYRVSMMFPLPGQLGGAKGGGGGTGGDKSYYIDSAVGRTVREAQAEMQKRMARRTFLSHRRTLVIGEDLAKEGIRPLFDAITRIPENRMTAYLIVCEGKAYEFMKANPRFERFPSEAFRELSKTRETLDIDSKDVGVALSSKGSDPLILYMGIRESEKSEKTSQEVTVLGYAVFRDDKMVATVKGDAARGMNWLLHKNKGYPLTFSALDEPEHVLTARLYDGETTISPSVANDRAHFKIDVHVKAKLLESKSAYDVSQIDKVRKIEEALSNNVKHSIQEAIKAMQQTGADPAQLGMKLWHKYPAVFESRFEDHWSQAIKDAAFDVQVHADLSDNGLIYKNLTEKERGK